MIWYDMYIVVFVDDVDGNQLNGSDPQKNDKIIVVNNDN